MGDVAAAGELPASVQAPSQKRQILVMGDAVLGLLRSDAVSAQTLIPNAVCMTEFAQQPGFVERAGKGNSKIPSYRAAA